jgi:hypothetical protein
LFIFYVFLPKKGIGVQLGYAYEGIFLSMPEIKIVLKAGWVHFRGCVTFFSQLLSFWGLNERVCETAFYAHDWRAGVIPMRIIGMLV